MDKQIFAIFSPQYELAKNVPNILLLKTLMPDSQNILLKDGKIVRRKMREKNLVTSEEVKVRTPDENPILHYHTFVKRSTGSQYLLGFTKAHIYCWDWDTKEWVLKFTCSADCENWETRSYNDKVMATNNVDPVLFWNTEGYFMPLQNTTPTNITAVTGGATINRTDIAFVDGGAGEDTITTVAGDFVTAGFVAGNSIKITGSTSNNGTYTIISVVALTINVATASLTTEAAGASVTIENGDPCQVTATAHSLTTGDRVFIKNCGGMTQINNIQFVVTVIDVNKFTLNGINSSTYTTYTSGGTVVEFQGIEYETGYFLTKAKHMTDYENFLILGYTYENGEWHPQRFRWNAIGNENEWIATNSGSTEVGKSDILKGFGKYQGLLIVFKASSYYKYWLTADTDLIFNGVFISMKIGCRCSKSIVNDSKGRLYWYASDGTFKEISAGTISQPIQTDIVDLIYQSSVEKIRSEFIDETEEVCWAVPIDNELNNLLLTFKESKWGQVDMAIPSFGGYREP